jgi:anti-sigma B factor antagonist
MHLEIEQRQKEGITILDLKGRIVLGPADRMLRERILSLLSQGIHNLILNMKEVSEIDTAGLGTVVLSAEKLRKSGGKLALAALGPGQVNAANLLKLDTTLEMYPEEQDAVNSFFPERAVQRYDILEVVEGLKTPQPSEQTVETRSDETK